MVQAKISCAPLLALRISKRHFLAATTRLRVPIALIVGILLAAFVYSHQTIQKEMPALHELVSDYEFAVDEWIELTNY
ncbi:hypothetical protein PAN31117_04649 [Pandoraea anapnoica]|uniref:Uncharacterized protein n=1 Tax=Pandoraea anapnoica TaxID=2508301 RepID=A0A5E5AHS4_9BURK|nr:hypothetical protein PAN31117_04649 [Pandoraea anapnoica]